MSLLPKNDREYLLTNKIATFGTTNLYLYHDARDNKDCYIIDGYDSKTNNLELSNFLKEHVDYDNTSVANIDGDAVLLGKNHSIVMFKYTDSSVVRKNVLCDDTPRNYKIAFKTAEFHSYVELIDTKTQKHYFFSASGRAPDKWHGPGYIRDDAKYDEKYYKGDIFMKPGELNSAFDIASLSTTFDLTDEEVLRLVVFVKKHMEYWETPGALPYDLFFHNCAYFAALVYNAVVNYQDEAMGEDHFYNYHIIDELDFRDKGVYFNYLVLNNNDWGVSNHWNTVMDVFYNYYYGSGTAELDGINYIQSGGSSRYDSHHNTAAHIAAYSGNVQTALDGMGDVNDFGQSPLHIALIYGNLETAKALINNGANVNALDARLASPLSYAVMYDSKTAEGVKIIKYLIDNSKTLNQVDVTEYITPLVIAVKQDNVEIVDYMISHGANTKFTDSNGDNILHLAHLAKAENVIEYLEKKVPSLMKLRNIDGETPFEVVEGRAMHTKYVPHDFINFLHDNGNCYPELTVALEEYYDLYPDKAHIAYNYTDLLC